MACTRQWSIWLSSCIWMMRYQEAPCSSAFNATTRSTSCGLPEILFTEIWPISFRPVNSQHWRILLTARWCSPGLRRATERSKQEFVSSSAPFHIFPVSAGQSFANKLPSLVAGMEFIVDRKMSMDAKQCKCRSKVNHYFRYKMACEYHCPVMMVSSIMIMT